MVKENVEEVDFKEIQSILNGMENGNLLTGNCKFDWIDRLINENVCQKKDIFKRSRFDRIATSKRWGKPVAVGIIILGFIASLIIGFSVDGTGYVGNV